MDGIFKDLATNLLADAIWMSFLIVVAGGWYWAWVRRRERRWIREHGVLLMVYFRNVDWRCKCLHERHRTHEELTDEAGTPTYVDSINWLRYELMKLEADLDALSLLVGIWERRIAEIPLWYPYSGLFREMLEAQVELQASLLRHTGPLRFLLDELAEGRASNDTFTEGLKYYWSYFHGKADRMWGDWLRTQNNQVGNGTVRSQELTNARKLGLYKRLLRLFKPLEELLRDVGHIDTKKLYIWSEEELPDEVWFPCDDPAQALSEFPAPPQARASSP